MQEISVIICTYHPTESIFRKCLDSIGIACTFRRPKEIIIIDNNSPAPIGGTKVVQEFIAATPNARVVIETKQGLTFARLKGISEATGELLVFIDDDNFIGPDFLKAGLEIANNYPMIGAFSGRVDLEFEVKPAPWTKRYWGLLVYRKFEQSRWSNLLNNGETMPCGAGLFVRREAAVYYLELHRSGRRAVQMDRTGNSLMSGGDNDLALCACDIGLGIGLFKEIFLTHFIPAKRLQLQYLLDLARAIATSAVILNSFRGIYVTEPSLATKTMNMVRFVIKNKIDRKFHAAVLRGEKEGKRMLKMK